jgi:hypothetical protein
MKETHRPNDIEPPVLVLALLLGIALLAAIVRFAA